MARKVDELPVFERVMTFWVAVSAIIERPQIRRNRKRYEQISEANDSIISNLREGFELTSDDEMAACDNMGDELGRMLGGFIKYLRRSGFKDRGSYRARKP